MILVVARVAPVHVQRPDVDRQLAAAPMRDVVLRLFIGVRMPVSEPRTECKVGQQGRGAREADEGLACGLPLREGGAEQEDVGVPVHVVAKVVAVRRRVRAASRRGCGAPLGRVEARIVREGVGARHEWRGPVEEVGLCGRRGGVVDHLAARIAQSERRHAHLARAGGGTPGAAAKLAPARAYEAHKVLEREAVGAVVVRLVHQGDAGRVVLASRAACGSVGSVEAIGILVGPHDATLRHVGRTLGRRASRRRGRTVA